ncbi:MAG: pyridoxal phosphate-dependent aminotransferase [Gammaproteobacteria bacterium]|nr:pyridoxal phosphate-dependent aminotransferase [Gammaproteobacteria bacterium]NNJ49257.1 pyridoxal phosphate-dependent aminotransferase [Gammaproteobacteria bacterium]
MTRPKLSRRAEQLNPFHVMDILAQAKALSRQGRTIFHMEVGEPDFATAEPIISAGIEALQQYSTHYTPALGLPELREEISGYYERKFSLQLDPRRVIITPGASGALQLAMLCLLDAGENVLLADPGYPCNRNIARVLAADAISVPVSAENYYQLDASSAAQHWNELTRAAMVASPSNPTGTILPREQLESLCQLVEKKQGRVIVDEIYQGLVYEQEEYTALQVSNECFVINSFSKYFGMTGWRLGWMVVPDYYVDAIDRIAQNIFLAPPTVSQVAALTALQTETQVILDARRDEFRQRRDFLLPALEQMGFEVAVKPQGAFYIYANCHRFTDDSFSWVKRLLIEQGVAVTPGIDFGSHLANIHCRFAYTQSLEILQLAVDKIDAFVRT